MVSDPGSAFYELCDLTRLFSFGIPSLNEAVSSARFVCYFEDWVD